MAGFNLNVLAPTNYNFSKVTGNSSTLVITVARRIDVSGYENVSLWVRAEGLAIPANDSILVTANPDGYAFDDPSTDFGGGGGAVTLASLTMDSTTVQNNFLRAVQPNGDYNIVSAGGLIAISVIAMRGPATGNATLTAKLSIDLAVKSGSGFQRPMRGSYLGYGARSIL